MTIRFFCTDRDQHRDVTLGTVGYFGALNSRAARNAPERPYWSEDGEWLGGVKPGEVGRRIKNGQPVLSPYARLSSDESVPVLDRGYELLCPKCGRNPQLGRAKFDSAIKALRAAGVTEVDISRLPF